MKSVRSGVSHTVAQGLRQEIITGKRAPGSPLRQDHIAEQYRASHVPVREALQALQAEGLVVYQPRKGASVAPISKADILDVVDMRIELEGLALKRAMQAGKKIDIEAAGEFIRQSEASDDPDIWVSANQSFHRTLYSPCQRQRLLATLEELWLHSERYLRMAWEKLDYQEKSQSEHRVILTLAAQNDLNSAVDRLKHHIRQAGQGLAKVLPDLDTGV